MLWSLSFQLFHFKKSAYIRRCIDISIHNSFTVVPTPGNVWMRDMRFGKLNVSSQYSAFTPSIKLPNLSKIGFETTIGMRYFLTENIGVYAEFGPAKSLIQGGLSVRF